MAASRWLHLLFCLALSCWLPVEARAQQGPKAVPLQCRLEQQSWHHCSMEVDQVGQHWYLVLDNQRIEFRHDGDGRIHMMRPGEGWQTVQSDWDPEGNLCWGSVCAKGDIPLD